MPDSSCENVNTTGCVHGTKPPCSCACPLNMNLREFMMKASKRTWDSTYRVLANDLIFPDIVTRLCGGSCAAHCAENIDILAVERACIQYASRKTPMKYSVAPKSKKIAVIGAGLSGLACVLRLAVRGFPVTLFDSRDEIGGTLYEDLEREIYQAEFTLQFKYAPYTFQGSTTVQSLDELSDYDAIYIATGKNGSDFGLREGWNEQSMATQKKGVWLGGELTGVSRLEGMAQGRVASTSIEKYLLMTESMAGVPASFIQRECLFPVENSGAQSEPHEGGFTKAGAKAEAARCRQCDCTVCFDECAFMQYVNMYPPAIETVAGSIAMRNTAVMEKEGSRMTFSCAACGHCGSVCPRGVSMEEVLIGAKRTLLHLDAFPPHIHTYYINDMLRANGEDALLQLPKSGAAEYLLFPGCQAAESGTEQVKAAYAYLNERCGATGIWMGCCGIPALWAGDEALFQQQLAKLRADWEAAGRPTVVLLCPTCSKTFQAHLPDISCISLYELIQQKGLPEQARRQTQETAIFDPCASRDFPEMQQAVRSLAEQTGAVLTELKSSGEQALCCGNGGQIYTANKKVAERMGENAANLSALPYLTYCENCRNTFLMRGKECRHILDDVFGLEPLTQAPHIADLKQNRVDLKRSFTEESTEKEPEDIQLVISDAVYEKMDRRLISAEDVRSVIRYGEQTHSRVRLEDNHYVGYLAVGYITFWVEYKKLDDGRFEVCSAYSHKMTILGNNTEEADNA